MATKWRIGTFYRYVFFLQKGDQSGSSAFSIQFLVVYMTTLRYLRFPKQEDRGGGKRRDNNISSLPSLLLYAWPHSERKWTRSGLSLEKLAKKECYFSHLVVKWQHIIRADKNSVPLLPTPSPLSKPLMPHGCVIPGETFIPPCFSSSSHRRNRRDEVSQCLSPPHRRRHFLVSLPPFSGGGV